MSTTGYDETISQAGSTSEKRLRKTTLQNIQIRGGVGRGAPNARVEIGPAGSEDHHGKAGCFPAVHEDIRTDLHAADNGGSQTEVKAWGERSVGGTAMDRWQLPTPCPICTIKDSGRKVEEPGVKLRLRRKEGLGKGVFSLFFLTTHLYF